MSANLRLWRWSSWKRSNGALFPSPRSWSTTMSVLCRETKATNSRPLPSQTQLEHSVSNAKVITSSTLRLRTSQHKPACVVLPRVIEGYTSSPAGSAKNVGDRSSCRVSSRHAIPLSCIGNQTPKSPLILAAPDDPSAASNELTPAFSINRAAQSRIDCRALHIRICRLSRTPCRAAAKRSGASLVHKALYPTCRRKE